MGSKKPKKPEKTPPSNYLEKKYGKEPPIDPKTDRWAWH